MNMASDNTELHLGRIAAGQRTLIRLALEKTQEMLREGQANNWGCIGALEEERRLLLDRCFSESIVPQNAQIFSEALAAMLHFNEELVALVNTAKVEVSLQYFGEQRGYKAVGHYLDASNESGADG